MAFSINTSAITYPAYLSRLENDGGQVEAAAQLASHDIEFENYDVVAYRHNGTAFCVEFPGAIFNTLGSQRV